VGGLTTDTASAAERKTPSFEQFRLKYRSASYWRVSFDHPPINTITAETVAELWDRRVLTAR